MNILEKELVPMVCKFNKERIGPNHDGGYVIIPEVVKYASSLVSGGVGGDIGFELEFEKKFDKPVYCWDKVPDYTAFPQFKTMAENTNISLSKQITYTKQHITADNINNIICSPVILKMDVEGCEWEIIRAMTKQSMDNIQMLVIEFHLNNMYAQTGNLLSTIDVFKKLNHYLSLVHVHGNNFENYIRGTRIPNVLECTYVSKEYITDQIDTSSYPMDKLDYPCNPNNKDLILEWWK